ncbi:hypothetical protein [Leisingera daeponensis]|uniref:hypothetical protein n=1 Tax=Leisingera daeponensis TaxID=405746 RepID=UPI001C9380A0|nr:hypothetical protein [Leisingera daeponensis]MBY6058948.1 hypothetical protein [Leisingera daeponensis]
MDGTLGHNFKFLPKLATGRLMSSFALAEPGVDSDAGAVCSTARRDVINAF